MLIPVIPMSRGETPKPSLKTDMSELSYRNPVCMGPHGTPLWSRRYKQGSLLAAEQFLSMVLCMENLTQEAAASSSCLLFRVAM